MKTITQEDLIILKEAVKIIGELEDKFIQMSPTTSTALCDAMSPLKETVIEMLEKAGESNDE